MWGLGFVAKLRPCYFTDVSPPTGGGGGCWFLFTLVYEFTNVNAHGRRGSRGTGARVGRGGSRAGGKSVAWGAVVRLRMAVGVLRVVELCEALCEVEWSCEALLRIGSAACRCA